MRAMILERPKTLLRMADLPEPKPGPGQVLIHVNVCGVCRTDLHVVDGELTEPKLPIVPGHQIVGVAVSAGERVERFSPGDRVDSVATVNRVARTSVTKRATPATRLMAASLRCVWPTSSFVIPFLKGTRICRRRLCCVRD
jgi:NADPH:quinone reductase-like Zn-dependent oxidoreductase